AQGLLREQYAPVAAAGLLTLEAERAALEAADKRGVSGSGEQAEHIRRRLIDLRAYRAAYARYCWDVRGIADLKIAPFHLLGVEALERFVHREPLRRVHECAFGVLALESEPVDPRL